MNVNLVVMPASPALVRELAPGDEAAGRLLGVLREVLEQAAARQQRIELVGSQASRWRTELRGSFQAWGAPGVVVGAGHYLPELVQRYVLAELALQVVSVRERLGVPNPAALTVVALDGSAGLDARAPLTLLDAAPAADAWCRDLLAGSAPTFPAAWDESSLREAGILEPDPWLELAALTPKQAQLRDADTTLGVGRYVATWEI
ncbi:hypothetical protein [Corynebacterium sp. A21]|uniref:hypothetical protein n=1 Tax=Corynebacterium sp. A21 TaxID=3457318 RepID=UPI003FD50BDC